MAKQRRWAEIMMQQYRTTPSQRDMLTAQARAYLAARPAPNRRRKPTRSVLESAPLPPVKRRPMPSGLQQQYGLSALAREAHRRGTTYGKLVSRLSAEEQDEIVRAYAAEKMLKRRGGRSHD